ncbi:hypothetical protein [Catenulispora pinisilvae]|uniref:hypothetical protein n=1 Tax=Catenulispora pinisilvae TaxID=2705253 RepID=UPI0018920AD4|nr:hypothetical protein [Catenulispora pinisilvae]
METTSNAPSSGRVAKLRQQVSACVGMRVHASQMRGDNILGVELVKEIESSSGSKPDRLKLWVYTPAWRLDAADRALAASGDNAEVIAAALTSLPGQHVTAVSIAHPSLDTTFTLTACRLRIFPVYYGSDERSFTWTLNSVPGRRLLAVGPGSNWSIRTRRDPQGGGPIDEEP